MSAPAADARLFLALWPDEPAGDAIVAWQSAFAWPAGASPSARQALHVTLHFLGDVPRTRLPELALGLRGPVEPFELVLDTAAVWPGGIAVLEPAQVPAALVDLHARLGAALRALGLRTEARPYRPHVTLARRASGARPPPTPQALPRWQASSWALVESTGGRYKTLAAFGHRPGDGDPAG
jgi:2'-5' RNA ligase